VLVGLAIALIVTLFAPLASSEPDGLERVAEDEAFQDKAKDAPYELIADYAFPWVENEEVATVLGGITGVIIVAAGAFGIGILLQLRARRSHAEAPVCGQNNSL
jgi:hypothetical protein